MIKLNRESWHYRLASKYMAIPSELWYEPNDICGYLRSVTRGLIWALLLTSTAALVIASLVVLPLLSVAAGGSWFLVANDPHNIILVVAAALQFDCCLCSIIGFPIYCIYCYFKNKKPSNAPPGFVKTAYRSFKEKTCILIEFEGS